MSLQIRRGTTAQRLAIVPQIAELVYTTDSKKVYIGDGLTAGGVPIADIPDLTGTTVSWNSTDSGNVTSNGTQVSISQVSSSSTGTALALYTALTTGVLVSGTTGSLVEFGNNTIEFTLTSGFTFDQNAGGGGGAWVASATVTSGTATSTMGASATFTTGGISYNDLTNKPTLFSGSYNDLTNKPTIPTNTNQLMNGAGFVTSSALSGYATETFVNSAVSNLVASAPAALDTLNELAAALGNDANYSTTISTALGNRLRVDVNTQGLTTTQKSNAATNLGLATVATSGSYNDLSNKPTIPTQYTDALARASNSFVAGSGAYNSTTGVITIPTNTSHLTNGAGFITASAISGKQDTLVSGTSIKTINGTSILGSGNITISGGSPTYAYNDAISLGYSTGSGAGRILLGNLAGNSGGDNYSIAIGHIAGQSNQGGAAIAIGQGAGYSQQGSYSIAIGYNAGNSSQSPNSIVLNATGNTLEANQSGFFVKPVRSDATPTDIIYYNSATGEMTFGAAPSGGSGSGGPTVVDLPIQNVYYFNTGPIYVELNFASPSSVSTFLANVASNVVTITGLSGPGISGSTMTITPAEGSWSQSGSSTVRLNYPLLGQSIMSDYPYSATSASYTYTASAGGSASGYFTRAATMVSGSNGTFTGPAAAGRLLILDPYVPNGGYVMNMNTMASMFDHITYMSSAGAPGPNGTAYPWLSMQSVTASSNIDVGFNNMVGGMVTLSMYVLDASSNYNTQSIYVTNGSGSTMGGQVSFSNYITMNMIPWGSPGWLYGAIYPMGGDFSTVTAAPGITTYWDSASQVLYFRCPASAWSGGSDITIGSGGSGSFSYQAIYFGS